MTDGPSDVRRVRLVRKRSAKRRRVILKRVRRPEDPIPEPVVPPPLARSVASGAGGAGPPTAVKRSAGPGGAQTATAGPCGPRSATAGTGTAAAARALDRSAPLELPDDLPLDDEAREGVRKLARSMAAQILPALIKRALTAGAEQLADEGLRRVGAEVAVPGELAGVVADRAHAFRGELSRLMAREIRELVSGNTVSQEIQKLLTSVTFEIKTEIRLRPNEDAVAPSVRSRVRVKRTPDDER